MSPRELVELYLERIERLDPRLNAFRVVMAERALTEADQAEARRAAGDQRPLLGVPVAIKDNVDVAGEVTTHGTAAHWGPATEDAEIVRRLRAAGAIVIGKTHSARAGACTLHRVHDLGRDAQSVGSGPLARRLERRRRGGGRIAGWSASPTRATAAARSGYRRPAAGCSGSSPSAGGSR